jgi:catechol 2,3-dioxygenase-like lactoylglutathione lyase family enzyme
MEYAYTNLVVEDVKSAAAFYQQAFAFTLDHAHDGWDYDEVRTGLTRIGLVAPSLVEAHLPIAVRVNKADETPAGVELRSLPMTSMPRSTELSKLVQQLSYRRRKSRGVELRTCAIRTAS